jgi:hypothetical protein
MSFESQLARCIVFAAIAGASVASAARTDDGRGHVATWVYDGPDRYYFVSLSAAGECSIALTDRATGSEKWHYCTYWIHGSRINFREWKWQNRPLLPIQAEYVPQSGVLILNGDEERPLQRVGSK